MSLTNRHKYKYLHSTVQRANDRRQKFHFCRLPFDVRPRNVKLNLSNLSTDSSTPSQTKQTSQQFFIMRKHLKLQKCHI